MLFTVSSCAFFLSRDLGFILIASLTIIIKYFSIEVYVLVGAVTNQVHRDIVRGTPLSNFLAS